MIQHLKSFYCEERGQGMTEYAFILALLAMAAVVALRVLGGHVVVLLNRAVDAFGLEGPG